MGMVGWAIAAYVVGAWLAGVPFTLLHELGHALAALALGVRRVIVTVGHPPARALELGRLELRVRLFNRPRWAWFGTIESPNDDELSRGRAIAFLAAGPAASTAALIGLLVAAATRPLAARPTRVGHRGGRRLAAARHRDTDALPELVRTVRRPSQRRLSNRPPHALEQRASGPVSGSVCRRPRRGAAQRRRLRIPPRRPS
jgi:hypothetical protein